jgi:hypothetical protein
LAARAAHAPKEPARYPRSGATAQGRAVIRAIRYFVCLPIAFVILIVAVPLCMVGMALVEFGAGLSIRLEI